MNDVKKILEQALVQLKKEHEAANSINPKPEIRIERIDNITDYINAAIRVFEKRERV